MDEAKIEGTGRTLDQLKAHYEVERELADRLRISTRADRKGLYSTIYDELFARVPNHPQLTRKFDPASYAWAIERQVRLIRRYLAADSVFLDIGAGDCALARAVAPLVDQVFALDVSEEITRNVDLPRNVRVVISDGCSIPVAPGSITLAYSNNLMEHLHPDDAIEQLTNIYAALASGGTYLCVTPNRLSGPHDISRYFDDVATGFHLKEYTAGELQRLFKTVGFRTVGVVVGGKGRYAEAPLWTAHALERSLSALPLRARHRLAGSTVLRGILGVRIAGRK